MTQCYYALPTTSNSVVLNVTTAGERDEEEEGARPERVNGLGEEAFWLASRVGGALYVLASALAAPVTRRAS